MRAVRAFPSDNRRGLAVRFWLAMSLSAMAPLVLCTGPAFALSEIQREELPAPNQPPAGEDASQPEMTVPMPDPVEAPPATGSEPASPEDGQAPEQVEPAKPDDGKTENPRPEAAQPLPEVHYDLQSLPEPVRRMHSLLVEACKSGDIEKLRPLIGTGETATQLSLTEIDGDAIAFLKGLSGDSEGQEILAIMEEVLNAGYVHLDAGTPQDLYVWPYFFAMPLDKLDARQRVELFKIVTAGDYDDMKQFGAYIFYRLGITPQGHWAFFVAGD
ncbi:hypothetical protein [Ollibium composti]